MKLRLLVDMEVVALMDAMPAKIRNKIVRRMLQIQDFPSNCSDFRERDETGRTLDISVVENWAIHYWADFNDRHVKVLKLTPADR
jgi:hypothetical protein